MSISIGTILNNCSYVLVEPIVATTLGTTITAGSHTVTPASMLGIYFGAMLIVGSGATQELVFVNAVTSTTFTAVFANAHNSTDPVTGATFPSGQTDAPLFTQQEMITYLLNVQDDFLLKVRPIYVVQENVPVTTGNRVYAQPVGCIRLERIAIETGGVVMDLYETSQSSLDMSDPTWQSEQNPPKQWFRDKVDTANYGYFPLPSSNFFAELWYSFRGSNSNNTLLTNILVPDVFWPFMVFGVLARCFSKDGEFRDPDRAMYFQKHYDLGVVLAQKFMNGFGFNLGEGPKDAEFSPMPIPQGAQ